MWCTSHGPAVTTRCYRATLLHLPPRHRDKVAVGKHGLLLLCHRRSPRAWQAAIMLQLERRRRRRRTTALHNFNIKAHSHRAVTVTGKSLGNNLPGSVTHKHRLRSSSLDEQAVSNSGTVTSFLLWRLQLSQTPRVTQCGRLDALIHAARQHQPGAYV